MDIHVNRRGTDGSITHYLSFKLVSWWYDPKYRIMTPYDIYIYGRLCKGERLCFSVLFLCYACYYMFGLCCPLMKGKLAEMFTCDLWSQLILCWVYMDFILCSLLSLSLLVDSAMIASFPCSICRLHMVHIAVMVAIMQLHKCPHQFHKLPVMVLTRLQHIQCRYSVLYNCTLYVSQLIQTIISKTSDTTITLVHQEH